MVTNNNPTWQLVWRRKSVGKARRSQPYNTSTNRRFQSMKQETCSRTSIESIDSEGPVNWENHRREPKREKASFSRQKQATKYQGPKNNSHQMKPRKKQTQQTRRLLVRRKIHLWIRMLQDLTTPMDGWFRLSMDLTINLRQASTLHNQAMSPRSASPASLFDHGHETRHCGEVVLSLGIVQFRGWAETRRMLWTEHRAGNLPKILRGCFTLLK